MITDAVIPVGGLGTRMLPATRSLPKEMLPLVDKPAVQYVVEELRDAGIERILFVTGRRKRAIEDHFDADPELERAVGEAASPASGLRIVYTRQRQPLGVGDALRYADGFAGQSGIVTAFGDAIISRPSDGSPSVVRRLIDAYEAADADAAVAVREVPVELVARYGIVAVGAQHGPAFDVEDVVEKPEPSLAPSRIAIMARYVLGPAVFEALAQIPPGAAGEIQLSDALRQVIREGGRVVAVPLTEGERRHDVGTLESYCAAFLEYALSDDRFGAELRARAAALLDARD
ncbi:MAG: UTP--glucose-1-phosphate uridylyltransferase [Solirubrobacteraceae bacterium]